MVYFISGLGADERVFQFLELPGIPVQHIKWLKPEKYEKLGYYAARLISLIDQREEVILVGLSFGGLVCQEIARHITVKKAIIISSIKSREEMDWKIRLAAFGKIYNLVPAEILKKIALLTANFFFSIENEKDAAFLKKIIEDTDSGFVKWALNEILQWQPPNEQPQVVHIHGTNDQIFPFRKLHPPVLKVENGGHFMIADKPKIVSKLLLDEILRT
ncbi:alpha/beta fold hydrolase [Adhaeribacter soli]|uniref:Alpha/beta hydrolase n=1 Tax=Adhaeribacter soli TaxID=2607655 RepID=A0A5N1JAS4_9BACT|nr:alpha/beta hydrolase [Adhaeribacter soli]KAA9346118.1 alpha/beta hydrolase [Adhaeribacter soli]